MSPSLVARRASRQGRAFLAWVEILLCLVPASAGWLFGFVLTVLMAIKILATGQPGALVLVVLILLGMFAALAGLVVLWRLLLPLALGREKIGPLPHWHVAGLAAGVMASGVGLILLVMGSLDRRATLWAWLFASPVVVAVHVALEDASSEGAGTESS